MSQIDDIEQALAQVVPLGTTPTPQQQRLGEEVAQQLASRERHPSASGATVVLVNLREVPTLDLLDELRRRVVLGMEER